MISIDPERASDAATLLRTASQATDDLIFDINAAVRLSAVIPPTRPVVSEIGEELFLLANVLTAKANLARGFTIGLLGIGTDYADRIALDELLASLADDDGYSPGLGGDLGVNYVIANFARFDLDGDGVLTKEEINSLRCEPGALSPQDVSALAALGNRSSLATGFTEKQLIELVEHNDALRLLSPLVAEIAATVHTQMSPEDLRNSLVKRFPHLTDEINALFDDELLMRSLTDGAPMIDLDAFVVRGINTGAYLHSGTAAIAFFESLPSAATRDIGIDIRLTDSDALAELHDVAAATTNDPLEVARFSYTMPETTSGFRNNAITTAYAEFSTDLEQYTNPGDDSGDPGPGGNTWLGYAVSASYTVGLAIIGDESFLGVGIHYDMSQAFADGNQIIAAGALPAFAGLAELYRYGKPTQAEIDAYLATFVDGEAEIRQAMNKQIQVINTDDQYERQKLQLESNTLLGLHEQTIVDNKLNFRILPLALQAGAQVASGVESCATSLNPLALPPLASLVPGTAPCSPNPRSGGEILTDTGTFKIKTGDDNVLKIPVDEHYTQADKSNNLVHDMQLDDLDLSLSIDGQADLTTVSDTTGIASDPSLWVDVNGDAKTSVDWSQLDDRVPPIYELFNEFQTDPILLESVKYHAGS